jgi:hypothetical protein
MDNYYLGRENQSGIGSNSFGLTAAVPNLTIRASWSVIQPTAGGPLVTTAIDAGIAAVGAGNLALIVGLNGPALPSWYGGSKVAGSFRGLPETYAVPWDPTYLSNVKSLVTALGAKYAGVKNLVRVCMNAVATQTNEVYLDQSDISLATWKAVGYSQNNVKTAFMSNLTALRGAFPTQLVQMAWLPGNAGFSFDPNGATLTSYLRGYFAALPNVINSNEGANSDWVMPFSPPAPFGYQSSTVLGSPGINESLALAVAAGASYYEIYPPDVQYV